MRGNNFNGVFFTEQAVPNARLLGPVRVEISRQNSNLFEVKTEISKQVLNHGGNALVNFRYGQRPHRGLKLLAFKWDTESWHGEGDAAIL
jgi:hypothetical protein